MRLLTRLFQKEGLALLLLISCSSHQTAPRPSESECTVYGHGPYNFNFNECLDLAKDQARTNCALKNQTSSASYTSIVYENSPVKRTGSCRSRYDRAKDDCLPDGCASDEK